MEKEHPERNFQESFLDRLSMNGPNYSRQRTVATYVFAIRWPFRANRIQSVGNWNRRMILHKLCLRRLAGKRLVSAQSPRLRRNQIPPSELDSRGHQNTRFKVQFENDGQARYLLLDLR